MWNEFKKEHGKALAAVNVTLHDHEASTPESEAYSEHVKGYPTVLFVKSGKSGKSGGSGPVVFSGERTVEGLLEFVKEQGYDPSSKERFLDDDVDDHVDDDETDNDDGPRGQRVSASSSATQVVRPSSGMERATMSAGKIYAEERKLYQRVQGNLDRETGMPLNK